LNIIYLARWSETEDSRGFVCDDDEILSFVIVLLFLCFCHSVRCEDGDKGEREGSEAMRVDVWRILQTSVKLTKRGDTMDLLLNTGEHHKKKAFRNSLDFLNNFDIYRILFRTLKLSELHKK